MADTMFKTMPWPTAESISSLVEDDKIFLILYKELYYRHIYSKLTPDIQQRFASWENYTELFSLIQDRTKPIGFQLPNNWLWDMIDEFVYQFQSFHQYRCKKANRSPEELALLQQYPDVWSAVQVLNYLTVFVTKSKIVSNLTFDKSVDVSGDLFTTDPLYMMLGYFSIIGLMRVHCLLGDYSLALSVLDPIDLNKKGLFTGEVACHITVYYYLAFCYLMTRRYLDALRAFQNIMLSLPTKQIHTRSYQHDQILKKNEQMYALLAITLSLCPQPMDEKVLSTLREKYGAKMPALQLGEEAAYVELFSYSCPKFITVHLPPQPLPADYDPQEAYHLQLNLFLKNVRLQSRLPTLQTFLKLYSTIEISKIASFLTVSEEEIRASLFALKHRSRGLVWHGGPASGGTVQTVLDVDFWLDGDVVHVIDHKQTVPTFSGHVLLGHITKLDAIAHSSQA
eukprot:c10012_g1_i2.p1 GENE.c10012_g1_i2~~c10012_g1_i2.p1  ORF type:complete len:524 (-),score=136.82 c10012_g1_i2:1096-2454(-)